jgi:bacillithiol biosynthesis cysteine-adding enzyme BshC
VHINVQIAKWLTVKADNWPGLSPLVKKHLSENQVSESTFYEEEFVAWDKGIQDVVVDVVREQYECLGLEIGGRVDRLAAKGVRTVTTGHQLQLCGGPAFLHYKTITTIRLARELEGKVGVPVVPVFWLAAEDHDFEEVSWVWGENERHGWEHPQGGLKLPVGTMSAEGLQEAVESWIKDMPANSANDAKELEGIVNCLNVAIDNGETYSQIFTRWMDFWYGDTGLVVLDASHKSLKMCASSLFTDELSGYGIASAVRESSDKLEISGFKTSTHIRDISLFYMKNHALRTSNPHPRTGVVIREEETVAGDIILNPDNKNWESWVLENAEDLSPGVLLRPLYQEFLLPNQIVVLGPGELNYWKQLESTFKLKNINMPRLHLRDHVLVMSKDFSEMACEMAWDFDKGWWRSEDFLKAFVDSVLNLKHSEEIDSIKASITRIEKSMSKIGEDIDPTLKATASASHSGMVKAIEGAMKKYRKAIRRLNKAELENIERLSQQIIKKGSPQDRWANFHVLASHMGGFRALRDELLNIDSGLKAVAHKVDLVN